MSEELSFILSVESEGVDAAAQKTTSAMASVGQGFAVAQKKVQDSAKAVQQHMGNIVSSVQSSAAQIQNQYNNMSLDKLGNEYTKIENKIQNQMLLVQQANQALEEYAQIYDHIAARGGTSMTADNDEQLAALAASARQAEAALRALKVEQQQVSEAMANATIKNQQVEQLNQQLAQTKQDTAQAKMGVDMLANSLATAGRASGGALGNITQLGMQVRYLKQGFTATAQTAGKTAATISTAFGAAGIAITGVMMIINAITQAQEEARRKAQELREEIKSLTSGNVGAAALVAEFESLNKKVVKTVDDTERMKDIRAELVDTYGFSVAAVDEEGRLLAGNLELMKEQLKVSRELLLSKLSANEAAEMKAYNDALEKRVGLKNREAELTNQISNYEAMMAKGEEWVSSGMRADKVSDLIAEREKWLTDVSNQLADIDNKGRAIINNLFQKMILEAQLGGKEVSEELQQAMREAMDNAFARSQDPTAAVNIAQQMMEKAFALDASIPPSTLESIKGLRQQLIAALVGNDEANDGEFKQTINSILDVIAGDAAKEQAIARMDELREIIMSGLATPEDMAEYDTLSKSLVGGFVDAQIQANEAVQAGVPGAENLKRAIGDVAKNYVIGAEATRRMAQEEKAAERQKARLERQIKDISDVLGDYEAGGKDAAKRTKDLADEMRSIAGQKQAVETLKSAKEGTQEWKDAIDVLNKAGFDTSQITADLPSVEQAVNEAEGSFITLLSTIAASAGVSFNPDTSQFESIQGDADATAVKIANVLNWLKGLDGAGFSMGADGKIDAVIPKMPKISGGGGGGGGGGKKNKALQRELDQLEHKRKMDQVTTAEEIALLEKALKRYAKTTEEKKQLTEELYALRKQKAEEDLEYKKAMDQLTLREEVAAVQKRVGEYKKGTQARRELEIELYELQKELRRQEFDLAVHYGQLTLEQQAAWLAEEIKRYKAGTQARIELEKELYDVRQEMRQRDADRLNGLIDAVTSALEARYEAQRDAENKRLEDSADAWQKWGDEQIDAIQRQIDALDELTKQEDDAEVEARKRRKIAQLEQAVMYEQDVYNRRKLQEQLAAAQDDLNKWLRDKEREALKNALRDQIDTINKTVDEQQAAIDAQIDANNEYYDQMTEQQRLQAEAQRLLMQSSQRDIIDLLNAFAPEYNATGQTLGEQLLDGFMGAVGGNIEAWWARLTAGLASSQLQLASSVGAAAANRFYASGGGAAQAGSVSTTTVGPTLNLYFTEQRDYTPAEIRREVERLLDQISQL